jgi:hypothetical protein
LLDWPFLSGAVPIVLRVGAGIAGVWLIACVLASCRPLRRKSLSWSGVW